MNISPFRAIYPNLKLIPQPDTFFATVKNEYPEYNKTGFFDLDDSVGMFIHEIDTGQRILTGLIACVNLSDYFDDRILRHERTIAAKEQNMMNLLLERRAMIKPVLLTHKRDKIVSELLEQIKQSEPFYSIDFESGEKHRVFKVSDKQRIRTIKKRFKKHIAQAYIADGHHRCVASAKLHETIGERREGTDFSQLLCAFFPFEDVIIHDYNRVVEILHEVSPTLFMACMSRIGKISPLKGASKPTGKFEITMYILGEWYSVRWKKSVLKQFADRRVLLDGEILNELVLRDILGIEDVRNDLRIKYVQGIAGVEGVANKVEKSIFRVAFCLWPVQMNEMVRVAKHQETLPPKSTWFEPRIKNGFIVKSFENTFS